MGGMDDVFTYRDGGENTFMPDTDNPRMPGKVGLQAIGGIMAHLGALTAIGCSTVNSYRRLWDTGFWAPVFADWGYQNRTTGMRVSAPGRFEYRAVDSMVNPYLMGSALLKAFDDGIENNLDPGDPKSAISTKRWKPASRLRNCRCHWATPYSVWTKTKSSSPRCPAKCTKFTSGIKTTSGKNSCLRSPTGILKHTSTACPSRPFKTYCLSHPSSFRGGGTKCFTEVTQYVWNCWPYP